MTTQEEFVDRVRRSADDLALLFAHESDERVVLSLKQMRDNLERELGGVFADPAGVADYFIGYLMQRRRGIESVSVPTSCCT